MKKVLGFCKRNSKALLMCMMISMFCVLSVVGASATDVTSTTTDLQSTFSSSLSSIQSDILTYIAIALPAGLTVFGAIIAIKKGINFVRGLIGKS